MDNFEIYTYLKARKNGGSSADSATLDALIDRSLTTISSSRVTSIGTHAFRSTSLTTAKFDKVVSIGNGAFMDCTGLTTLILSTTSVVSLLNTNALSNTRISRGMGYIYFPDDLVDDYKIATNWVLYADQIKGLSELEGA